MNTDLPFRFGDADNFGAQTFVLHVPKGVQSKSELLSWYEEAGKFPDYFGRNWDAFEELLRDFSWIEQPRIFIIHQDLPLRTDKREFRTYIQILRSAAVRDTAGSNGLCVYFPSRVRDELIRLLKEN
jgi:hypothetical protein